MYSFGRRWKYYAFYGGFVKETAYMGVFGAYPNTDIVLIPFDVTETQYQAICAYVQGMYQRRKSYKYSWLGLFMVLFRKRLKRKRHYYCSEFVQDILVRFSVAKEEDFPTVITPNDFLHIFGDKKTYVGKYRDYLTESFEVTKKAV